MSTTEAVSRVARAGALSLVGAAVSSVAGVLLVAVITRGLSQDSAGTVFATTSLFLIVLAVVQLGTEVGLVKWLPSHLSTGRAADALPTLRAALWPVATASLVVAVAGFLTAEPVARLVAGGRDLAEVTGQVRVLAVVLPVAAVYTVLLAATRGFRSMRPTVVVESIGRHGAQVLTVGLTVLLGLGTVAVVAAWAAPYVAGVLVAAAWLAVLLRRSARAAAGTGEPPTARRLLTRQFWAFTAPRALATVSQVVLKRSDILLVAALRSPAEAALYTAATRFVVFGQLGVQALQQAVGPHLSALFARGERATAQQVYRASTSWAMALAWPVYLASAVLAPVLLALFGAGYDVAAPVVVILSLTMLVATACGSVDTVLLMAGRSWASLVNNGIATVVNVGLNVWLIPRYGIVGAGVAWAVAIGVRNLLPLLQIRRSLGMSPFDRGSAVVAASALGCFGVLPGALALAGAPVAAVIAALAVGAVGYAACLWFGRRVVHLAALRGVLRRRGGGGAGAPPGPADAATPAGR